MSTGISCLHCGQDLGEQNVSASQFCCSGCEAAYSLIQGLGLDTYYARRSIDPSPGPPRPDEEARPADFSAHTATTPDGHATLHLMVDGLQCAACVWLIETVLRSGTGGVHAPLNTPTHPPP